MRRLKEIDNNVDQYLKQIIRADRLEAPLQKTNARNAHEHYETGNLDE